MKIRNPLIIRSVALLVSWVVRVWLSTLSYRIVLDDGSTPPRLTMRRGVYLFWHEMLLFPTAYVGSGFAVLISRHADGELIGQVVRMMGGHAVRGSTNKAGLTALRTLMRTGRIRHLAITPDGPRGPRRVVQPGAVYLASKTGMPLIVVGFGVRDCWRNRSWDQLAVPKPGTVAAVVLGSALEIPPDLNREGIEFHRQRAQAALDNVQRRAEAIAARGPSRAGGVRGTPLVS